MISGWIARTRDSTRFEIHVAAVEVSATNPPVARRRAILATVSTLALFAVALYFLHRSLAGLSLDQVYAAIRGRSAGQVGLAVGFAVADVLPFIVNRLSGPSRSSLAVVAPMAISRKADFEFHVTNWLGDEGDRDTLPEMTRLSGQGVLCIHGKDEEDSLCPLLDSRGFHDIELPGGHDFDGDYARLSDAVLAAADRTAADRSH